jgi:glutathione S-transferase
MMRIHDFRGFPNPARVRIAVAEKGLSDAIEFVSVDVPGGEHKRAEFLLRNPAGAVPVLELEDGTHIAECTAITEYLDHLEGEPVLTGKGARSRALIHMMQRRAEATLLDAVATYFHHATPASVRTSRPIRTRNGASKPPPGPRWDARPRHASRPPALSRGESFTMADITAFAGLAFADIAKIEVPADLTHLKAWRARVAARPSVAHA